MSLVCSDLAAILNAKVLCAVITHVHWFIVVLIIAFDKAACVGLCSVWEIVFFPWLEVGCWPLDIGGMASPVYRHLGFLFNFDTWCQADICLLVCLCIVVIWLTIYRRPSCHVIVVIVVVVVVVVWLFVVVVWPTIHWSPSSHATWQPPASSSCSCSNCSCCSCCASCYCSCCLCCSCHCCLCVVVVWSTINRSASCYVMGQLSASSIYCSCSCCSRCFCCCSCGFPSGSCGSPSCHVIVVVVVVFIIGTISNKL